MKIIVTLIFQNLTTNSHNYILLCVILTINYYTSFLLTRDIATQKYYHKTHLSDLFNNVLFINFIHNTTQPQFYVVIVLTNTFHWLPRCIILSLSSMTNQPVFLKLLIILSYTWIHHAIKQFWWEWNAVKSCDGSYHRNIVVLLPTFELQIWFAICGKNLATLDSKLSIYSNTWIDYFQLTG